MLLPELVDGIDFSFRSLFSSSLAVPACVSTVTFSYELNFNASASVNGLPARLSASPATVAVAAGTPANISIIVTAPNQLDSMQYVFSVVRLPAAVEAQFLTVRGIEQERRPATPVPRLLQLINLPL